MSEYVEALRVEMEMRKSEQAHPIHTVYFGGGTPSILPIGQLERIIEGMHDCFDLSHVEEMTLEANPEDLSLDYLTALRSFGFNRLSIGVQSHDDRILRLLNRRHTAVQAFNAIWQAHLAGFDNVSVDFIYGLPEAETCSHVMENVEYVEMLKNVTHVSAYALTVEPGTALAKQVEQGRVSLPDEDQVVQQYYVLHRVLLEAGFRQYEVSNYARPGYESRHNSRYWKRIPYLGLGPAAHSFDGLHRRWNISSVEDYVDGLSGRLPVSTISEEETLSDADALNELLMTSLRTVEGMPLTAIPEIYKERLHRGIQPYIDSGWIVESAGYYQPTTEGLLHADGIAASLFV